MTTKILKNINLALIFLVLIIPLYVSNNLFFPFITGKGFVFRILVEIIFAIWVVLMLRDRKYAPKFSWLSVMVTVFALVVLVADLLGMNPIRSLWSNFERMEGWIVIVHLWAYFMAVTSIFGSYGHAYYGQLSGNGGSKNNDLNQGSKRIWHYFFNTTLVVAFIVAIYGVVQLAGGAEIHQGSNRPDASLGNAAYMAVYMLMHIFIAFYMSLVSRDKKRMVLFWLYIILGVFFAFILYETGTRGTFIGLIGGIMLALAIYAVFGRSKNGQSNKSRWISTLIILAIVALGILFYLNRDLSFIQKNEILNRLASISLSDTKTQARGFIWPMAIKETFGSPKTAIIGLGQENFNYIFNSNYNPEMWRHEQWFDRAHSVFIDWLVAGGLIGLIAYLFLFVFAVIYIWKSRLTFSEKAVLTGLISAYAIHNIFVFDNLVSYLFFFTVIGFIHSLNAVTPIKWLEISNEQSENKIIVRDYIFVPITVILLMTTLYFIDIRPIQANTRLMKALQSCSGGGVPSASFFAEALSLNQYMANQEIREQLTSCSSNVIRGQLSNESKTEFYNLTKKEIEEQIKDTPGDIRAYVIGGSFFNNIGDWENGRPLLEKAYEMSLTKQTIAFELATNYMNTGKEKEALVILEKAYNSATDNETARVAYVSLLILNGQEKKAKDLFGNDESIFTDQRIINVYNKLKQYSKVIDAYKKLIVKDPNNLQYHATLAITYLNNGERSMSLVELKNMLVKFPQVKSQIEEAIKQIQEGKNPF